MDSQKLLSYIKTALVDKIEIATVDDKFLIQLPFTNYKGDHIEIEVMPSENGHILLDDVGFIAGLLFELNEYGEEAPAHLITKQLAESYNLTMNYDEGVINGYASVSEEIEGLLDFIKVITSIETVLPFIRKPRKRIEGRKRLSAKLSRDITQLRLPWEVQKQTKVDGKYETWDIDYKYVRKEDNVDILILTADLGLKEPKEKAAHVITLAGDLLDKDLGLQVRRELRVVYSLNGNGNNSTRRAANMVDDYQRRIGYRAFNYADIESKSLFTNLTIQDLSPMKL